MQKDRIGLAGKGWGAKAALRGLQKYFNVQCLSKDPDVLSELTIGSSQIFSFENFKCDLVICAGYEPIISKNILTKYEVLNIHYSLLPAYRGWHSTAWAIMNGEEFLGLSIFKMNEFIDAGSILYQKKFKNDYLSSATFYMNLMNHHIEEKLSDIITQYKQGLLAPKEQNKNIASWVGKRNEIHNLIAFNKEFEYCKRLFRVLQYPYPKPQIKYNQNFYTVGEIKFHSSSIITDIGRILNIDDEGIWVKSIDGYFILNDIRDKFNNKVKQHTFKIGTYLND